MFLHGDKPQYIVTEYPSSNPYTVIHSRAFNGTKVTRCCLECVCETAIDFLQGRATVYENRQNECVLSLKTHERAGRAAIRVLYQCIVP